MVGGRKLNQVFDALRGALRWFWCVMFHKWIRYDRIHPVGGEVEEFCYCTTCGRDR